MFLLRKITIHILIGLAFIISCKSQGALTPEEAFTSLRTAYSNSDSQGVVDILSKESIEKIRRVINMISNFGKNQLKCFSKITGLDTTSLMNLSVRDYISLQIAIGKRLGEDVIREASQYNIIEVAFKKNRAVIKVENGLELNFIKEGAYWKFDIDDL